MKNLLKKELIAAVVASVLITAFVQPVLQFIWALLPTLGSTVLSRWIDHVYRGAASGENNRVVLTVLMYLMLAVCGFVGGYLAQRTPGSLKKETESAAAADAESEDSGGVSEKERLRRNSERLARLRTQLADNEARLAGLVKRYTRYYYAAVVLLVAFGLLVGATVTEELVMVQLNTSFNQRLTVLAPKISDLEYKEIRAAWASMESRQEYLSIKSNMEMLAEQNQVVLPVPSLP